jgi:hypothetical protein
MNNKNWDSERISKSFENKTRFLEIRIKECKSKIKQNISPNTYKRQHDEVLAEFHLANYCCYKSFLESKQSFVAELKSLLNSPLSFSNEAYDKEYFMSRLNHEVKTLLNEYEVI